jgi:hypothetical protein
VTVRVELPAPLRALARIEGDIVFDIDGAVTQRTVLDAVEARWPALRGAIRDHGTQRRRAFVRFYACNTDLSHDAPDAPLPDAVAEGREPFVVVGATAGG